MHLLSINDLSKSDMLRIFDISDRLKAGDPRQHLTDAILALIFEKPSTRTRVSLESAIIELGGSAIYLAENTLQTSRGESIEDTARILSLYVDAIAARLYKHSTLTQFASASSIPVINALTDLEHPCQALSDMYTILEHSKGKKSRIVFIGDVDANTAHSLMLAATKLGHEIALVGPKAIKPNPEYLRVARRYGTVEIYTDIKEGLKDADIVYTDTFVSMGEESEARQRMSILMPYQLNKKALGHAKKNAIVMHCLPAHRGEEITSDVIDGERSIVWRQAKNKLIVEKAILIYLLQKPR